MVPLTAVTNCFFVEYKIRDCTLDVRNWLSFFDKWNVFDPAAPKDQPVSIDLAKSGNTKNELFLPLLSVWAKTDMCINKINVSSHLIAIFGVMFRKYVLKIRR